MVYETQFHVWFGTRTHGVKLFLWVRGSQSVISHEVCVSQSCLHWIIQYLSFNDIWIGICMQTVQWLDERRQTNFWFLAGSLGWDRFSAHRGISPPWASPRAGGLQYLQRLCTAPGACQSFSLGPSHHETNYGGQGWHCWGTFPFQLCAVTNQGSVLGSTAWPWLGEDKPYSSLLSVPDGREKVGREARTSPEHRKHTSEMSAWGFSAYTGTVWPILHWHSWGHECQW